MLNKVDNVCLYFFFFKQKTAYEMRISDWSSDVCSSDLAPGQFFWNQEAQAELQAKLAGLSEKLENLGAEISAATSDQVREKIGREMEIGGASFRERVCQYV